MHYVVHELLHIVFYERLLGSVDETLEEVIIVSLDQFMFDYIQASKNRLSKWQALIERKLRESTPPEPKSLAELVDRSADEAKNVL